MDFVGLTTVLAYNDEAGEHALERGLSQPMLIELKFQGAPADESLDQFEARLKCLDDRIHRSEGLEKSQVVAPRPVTAHPSGLPRPAPRAGSRPIDPHPKRPSSDIGPIGRPYRVYAMVTDMGDQALDNNAGAPMPAPLRKTTSPAPNRRENKASKVAWWPCLRRWGCRFVYVTFVFIS